MAQGVVNWMAPHWSLGLMAGEGRAEIGTAESPAYSPQWSPGLIAEEGRMRSPLRQAST